MKVWKLLTIVIITGAIAAMAWAGPGRPGPRGEKRGHQGQDPSRVVQWLTQHPEKATELGVTSEQLQQVKDLVFEAQKRSIQKEADVKSAHLDLRQLLQAEEPDKAAVMEAIEKTGALQTELKKEHVGMMLDVRGVLGAETMAKLRRGAQEKMRDRKGSREGRKGDRPGRRGEGNPFDGQGPRATDDAPPWMQDQMTDKNDEGV